MEKLVLIGEMMRREMPRRFVRVGRPALHAGLGNALREAYDLNGASRDLARFEDLIKQLS